MSARRILKSHLDRAQWMSKRGIVRLPKKFQVPISAQFAAGCKSPANMIPQPIPVAFGALISEYVSRHQSVGGMAGIGIENCSDVCEPAATPLPAIEMGPHALVSKQVRQFPEGSQLAVVFRKGIDHVPGPAYCTIPSDRQL